MSSSLFFQKHVDANHVCTLKDDKWYIARQNTCYGKYCSVSPKNPRSRAFFRTKNELFLEKKRHLESKYFYIIHPLSVFSFYWCMLLVTAYFFSLLIIPISVLNTKINIAGSLSEKCTLTWDRICVLIVDFLGVLEVVRRFFTGIVSNKHIMLNHNKIVIDYLTGLQCYIDITTSLPIYLMCDSLKYNEDLWSAVVMTTFIKVLRVRKIMLVIYRSTTVGISWLNINTYYVIIYSVGCLLWIHWTGCLLPTLSYYAGGGSLPNNSWLIKEIGSNLGNLGLTYKSSLFWSTAIFLCVRHTSHEFEEPSEIALLMLSYICGYVACAIFFVFILQMVMSFSVRPLKYEALTNQLAKYMSYRQLSINLQQKMLDYYDYKFNSIYFREPKLMSVLTDQLRKEINLYHYVNLVKSVNILHHISDAAVQEIVTNLKMELFLPNDVIIKAGTEGDCMYFLAAGTVAMYTPMGREICHLTDGCYFGEVELIRKDNKRITSVIAIEICEVYRLERKDFKRSLANEPETYKYLEKVALDRATNAAFLEELHKKHILERNMAVNYNS